MEWIVFGSKVDLQNKYFGLQIIGGIEFVEILRLASRPEVIGCMLSLDRKEGRSSDFGFDRMSGPQLLH